MSWVKKVFTDFTTIIDAAFLNGLQDQIITDEETLAAKAGQGSLAEEYSASSTYAVGDVCTHEGGLYQCTTAIATAEEWNAAHWEAVIIGDEVTRLNQAINVLHQVVSITLTADSWINNQQSAVVTGVLADETKQMISPIPANASKNAYVAAGVMATTQAANSLTFSCVHVPTADLSVYIFIDEVVSV